MKDSILPETGFRVSALVFLSSRAGSFCKPLISITVTLLFLWLSSLNNVVAAQLAQIDQPALICSLAMFFQAWLNAWTSNHLTNGAKAVQEALNTGMPRHAQVDVDGVIATQTLNELRDQLPGVLG